MEKHAIPSITGNDSGEVCRISENNVNSHIVQNRYHSDGQYALPPCQNHETGIGANQG